jgi:hypothetical protein
METNTGMVSSSLANESGVNQEDFISSLFRNGFHDILEKVTLNLPARSQC